MRYSLEAGGKRIRPVLVTEFCRLCGGTPEMSAAPAAAIEMIHTFSLIHDDLPAMDDDELRRGKPTNHVIYGEATAILAGDALLTEAFGAVCANAYCSDAQNMKAVRLLAKKTGAHGMTGGQQIDIRCEGMKNVTGETLTELQELKTACLISCACMLGCIAANADDTLVAAAEEYGKSLGLAFQIKDDLLDIEGSAENMGKAVGKDSVIHKVTYPSVYGTDRSKYALRQLTDKAIAAAKRFPCEEGAQMLADYAKSLMDRVN